MEGRDYSQSTKKLNYHKISKSHSNTANEWISHNNISTSPTHKVTRYTNIILLDNNQHYSSEPKDDDHMSTDSFENQVQSTVQAISEQNKLSVSMKMYIEKSTKLLSVLDSSTKYFEETKDFLKKKDIKAKAKQYSNLQVLLHQINIEKEKKKKLEERLFKARSKSIPASLSSDRDRLLKYSEYMKGKIDIISDDNDNIQLLINKATQEALSNNNNMKIEHFLIKETDRIERALAFINSLDCNNCQNYKQNYQRDNVHNEDLIDEIGKNCFNNNFKITNMSDNSQQNELKISAEAIVESDSIKADQMFRHNSKITNKTSENSIDNIALKDLRSNYHSNANFAKMTNGAFKSLNYKTNTSNLSNSGNNTKANYAIPKRFNKK